MARTKTAPSAASRPQASHGAPQPIPRPPTASPPKVSRPLPRPPSRPPVSPSKPSTLRRTPMREQPPAAQNVQNFDVECLDLTEDMPLSSPSPKKQVTSNTGRKRKSEEFDRDARINAVPAKRTALPAKMPFRPSQEFLSIDEMESPEKMRDSDMTYPSHPPPPYSTMAPPKVKSPLRSPRRDAVVAPVKVAPPAKRSQEYEILDSDEEEEELMNFSEPVRNQKQIPRHHNTPSKAESASHKAKQAATPPRKSPPPKADKSPAMQGVVYYPDLTPAIAANVELANRVKQPSANSPAPTATPAAQQTRIEVPPTTGGHQISPTKEQNLSLLKLFFEAPKAALADAERNIEAQMESILDAEGDLFELGTEDAELARQRVALEGRTDAFKTLQGKSTAYQQAVDAIAKLKADFVKALKARQSTDEFKSARDSAHSSLRELEEECLALLEVCKEDVRTAVDYTERQSLREQRVAVESTQIPHNQAANDRRAAIPSSSRIAQTQIPVLPEPKAKSRGTDAQPHRSPVHQQQPADDSAMFDDNDGFDELEDSEMTDANNNLFTNRMGTPPMQYDVDDDDDYGMNDDDEDIMLETELRSTKPQKGPQSQAKPVSARAKRTSAPEQEELNPVDFSYPWSDEVSRVLKEKFRLRGFRENQLQAINATLAGKHSFVLMPTGGGKSLCYQLPALVKSGKTRGVTIVISPLVSLMEDQVQHLRSRGVQAFLINSETSREERFSLMDGMKRDNVEKFIQLLYITPEMLSKSQAMIDNFERLYHRQRMARLVIDEAHCVSQWGHDFRPDYTAIGEVRRKFPGVPVMALTATATEAVKVDTIHNLGIEGCEVFTRSFNRPNLYYEVRMKGKAKEDTETIANLIKEKHKNQTGIIYCFSRKNCEDMAKALQKDYGIKAHHYHAGMETAAKSQVQRAWQEGEYHVIVATIAFGMGIDKANVRYVIHHSIPKSLEGYYQETGRAGRDGRDSSCYLFYGYQDATKIRRMIDEGDGSREQKDRQRQMLRKMTQYCDNKSDCRRVQVLRYFSEHFDRENCEQNCDNCNSTSTFENVDYSEYAHDAVRLVKSIGPDIATILHCIDAFRGAENHKKIKALNHDKLDQFGAGSDIERGDIERLFYNLLAEQAIREENVMNKKSGFATPYVRLGPKADDYLNGRATFTMQIRTSPRKPMKPPAKKTKTKKAAVPREMPMSTNISSPIQQAAASKRKRPGHQTTLRELHANGYSRDDFVVSDPEDGDFQGFDDDESDAFETAHTAAKPRKARAAKESGPSKLSAFAFEQIDEIHQFVVDDFLNRAEKKVKDIMSKRNLKMAPFTNTMLREMAINFIDTEEKMLKIRGIDPERVKLYGRHFTKMAGDARARYEEMSGAQVDEAEDQHAQNVIDLVSDDDDNQYGSMPEDSEEDEPGEQSRYFETAQDDHEVADFNARFAYSQSVGMRTMPESQSAKRSSPKNSRKRTYKPTAHRGRGGSKATASRRASGGSRSASGAGVQKRTAAKAKNGRSAAGSSKSGAASRTAGGGKGGGYGGVVTMMPT